MRCSLRACIVSYVPALLLAQLPQASCCHKHCTLFNRCCPLLAFTGSSKAADDLVLLLMPSGVQDLLPQQRVMQQQQQLPGQSASQLHQQQPGQQESQCFVRWPQWEAPGNRRLWCSPLCRPGGAATRRWGMDHSSRSTSRSSSGSSRRRCCG